jgi:signal peptidase I
MIRRLVFLYFIAAVCTIFLRTFVVEGIYVASASMEPALPVNTHLFLETITLRFHKPSRGDIVVFRSPVDPGRDLIKRVIALPGDTIEIKEKVVYLNAAELKEDYVQHTRALELLEGDNMGPLTVPEDAVFVMGDNRDESGDSRDWKDGKTGERRYFVPIKSIKGKIILFY